MKSCCARIRVLNFVAIFRIRKISFAPAGGILLRKQHAHASTKSSNIPIFHLDVISLKFLATTTTVMVPQRCLFVEFYALSDYLYVCIF